MKTLHPANVHAGRRVRQRRILLGMNQTKLGDAVGLTFQQIQKYERGANRMGSSRLFEFAKVLDVPVSYFFDEMPSTALAGRQMSGRGRKGAAEASTPFSRDNDMLIKRETLDWCGPTTRLATAEHAGASSRWSGRWAQAERQRR
jgi:transcriptional regulator with XRE-family HTH domain